MAQKKNNASLERQVRDAIRKLTDDGMQVTNQAVRDILGGGSFRDVSPLVKLVKAEFAAQDQAARLAPEMPDDVRDAAAAMWQIAWDAADQSAALQRRAHAAEIEKLKAEADEALLNCALVEDERDVAESRAQALELELDETRTALHDAKLEIARLTGQLTEREQHIQKWLAEPSTAGGSGSEDAPKVDDAQLDMFAPEKADKPGNSASIAAE